MSPTIPIQKNIVRWALLFILVLDVVLLGLNYKLSQSPEVSAADLNRLMLLEKSYRADNARLEKFRTDLPADEKQWDEFFTSNFRPSTAGYSAVSEDLGELSHSAGLHTDAITFHQHTPDARGLMEIEITTAVEGDYTSLVNFLDKLEHSKNFYVLDSLALAGSNGRETKAEYSIEDLFPDP